MQHVLDDPLLALARPNGESVRHMRYVYPPELFYRTDPSFQILHAVHSMERFLDEMLKRSAVFDIVFWEGKPNEVLYFSYLILTDCSDTRHLTLKGSTDFLVSSRLLARALLFSHLVEHCSKMGLEVYAFLNLADPAWQAYQKRTKVCYRTRVLTLLTALLANVCDAQRWWNA